MGLIEKRSSADVFSSAVLIDTTICPSADNGITGAVCELVAKDIEAFEGMSDGEISDESVGAVAGGIDWEALARRVIKEGEVL